MIQFKKNRKIFFGIVSCALVALASVGFSSWIISIKQPNQDFDIAISVDAMSFETVICEANLDKGENPTITLGPTKVDDSGIVGGNTAEEDLTTPITGQVIVANEEMKKVTGIKISVATFNDIDKTKDTNEIKVGANDIFGRAAGTYYYLKPSIETISKDNLGFSNYDVGGFKSANLETTLSTLSIEYASFFGESENTNPTSFYTTKLTELRNKYLSTGSDHISAKTYLTAIKTAQDEITAMSNAIKSLTIKIEVTKTGANQ